MSWMRRCDGPGCETLQKVDSSLKQDWITISSPELLQGERHVCSWDCYLKFGAATFPLTTIEPR